MAGISDKALKTNYAENKYRYNKGSELQNKEFLDGSGLEMYETQLRELDPQLGRWWQIDSKPTEAENPFASMGNNPILKNDPLGDEPDGWKGCCLLEYAKFALQIFFSSTESGIKRTAEPLRQVIISAGSTANGYLNTATAGAWSTDPAGTLGFNSETNPSATNMGQLGGIFSPNPLHTGPDLQLAPDGGSLVTPAASNFTPTLPGSRVDASGNNQTSGNTAKSPAKLGKEGMASAGIPQNTTRIPSESGTANYRVPDGLTNNTISEVKNVAKQSLTNQIKDYMSHAQQYKKSFILFVRPSTQLSNPVQDLVNKGYIDLQYLK